MADSLGIRRYDFVEFYVGSARHTAYWYAKALGMQLAGYRGPETGCRDRASYYLVKNGLKLVVTSALGPGTEEIQDFVRRHGDGVKRWSIEVHDVEKAFAQAVERGAVPVKAPALSEDGRGSIAEAAIRLYDDTELVFINRDHYQGIFRPGFAAPPMHWNIEAEDTGLVAIDHIVGNVRQNEMDAWAGYFTRALGFETFIEFKPGDIGTQYSALLSKVVRSDLGLIKNPINEPFQGRMKSQIEEFIDEYRGSGVQHIAITTNDIVKTIAALRKNGVEFLTVPNAYYEAMRSKKDLRLQESIDDLQRHGILFDNEGEGYLLQLFTKPIGDRPTFFFEFLQRRNAHGFGKGNFQALFESIEEDQRRRGMLERAPAR